ncbi:MAG: hypothetical protein ACK4F9_03795 [Brevinematia bacterium]
MKTNFGITADEIKSDILLTLRFFYILSISLSTFLTFSILYGIENLIKVTYILTKPKMTDILAIYFLQNIIDILPFVVIFSLAYFAYKLNYNSLWDILRLSIILGIFIYILFFVIILLSPNIEKIVSSAYKNFSTSMSTPKYLFTKSKIHFTGKETLIPTFIGKNSFNSTVLKNNKITKYQNLKVVPYDLGIKIKIGNITISEITYEKIIPPSFGKLYEKIYRAFIKIATQFPLTKYVEKFNFANFLNLMLYTQALTIGIIYSVSLFRDTSTTKVLLLSLLVSIAGVTVIGFLSSVFEFMKFSSLLETIKDIISGSLAILLSILITTGFYKVDQILKGRVR